ncbi:MAG: heavy-metal-associated domain-containing protein [Candidatus Kapabacteria bacterium]|nr:heavy-metal-associated domain-containing protein [Candidatus Kapabacteria bacterium]
MIRKNVLAIFLMAFFLFSMNSFAETKLEECNIKTNAHCGDCKSKIEKALKKQGGVMSTNLNLDNKIVSVKYDPNKTNTDKLISAITTAGYTAELVSNKDEIKSETSTKAKSSKGDCCKSGVKASTEDCCKTKKK